MRVLIVTLLAVILFMVWGSADGQVIPLPTATPTGVFASPTGTPAAASQPTPTRTPVTGFTLRPGITRGLVPERGGEVWFYAGRRGEVLTILVQADNPARNGEEREYDDTGLDTLLIVRDPEGVVLGEFDDIENGVITNSLAEAVELPVDGIYEIEVRNWEDRSGGAYTLTLQTSR